MAETPVTQWGGGDYQAASASRVATNVTAYGAVGDGVTNDLAAFRDAITAAPAGGTIYVPPSSSFYKIDTPLNANIALAITKNLTFRGDGPGTRIKRGPEAPASGAFILFQSEDGVTLTIENLTLEGPDDDGGRLFRAVYHHGATGRVNLHRVTTSKWAEVLTTDNATVANALIVDISDCDLQNSTTVPDLNMLLIGNYVAIRIRDSRLTGGTDEALSNYALYCTTSSSLEWDNNTTLGRFDYAIHPEGGPSVAPAVWRVTNSSFLHEYDGPIASVAVLTNRLAPSLVANNLFKPASGSDASPTAITMRGPVLVDGNIFDGPVTSTGMISGATVGLFEIRNNKHLNNAVMVLGSSAADAGYVFLIDHNSWDNDTTTEQYCLDMDVQHGVFIVRENYFRGSSVAQARIVTRGNDSELHAIDNTFMNSSGVYGTLVTLAGANTLARYEIARNRYADTATTDQLNGATVTLANVPVVQGASVADATGGSVIDVEGRAATNALIARLEAAGIIAT